MENIDIIILNLIVVVSFIAFFVSTFKAFEKVNKIGIKNLEKKELLQDFLITLKVCYSLLFG